MQGSATYRKIREANVFLAHTLKECNKQRHGFELNLRVGVKESKRHPLENEVQTRVDGFKIGIRIQVGNEYIKRLSMHEQTVCVYV